MNETNSTEQYIDHINRHILPFIDYNKLQNSYETDMVYAKGVLNQLHEDMVSFYGGESLNEYDLGGDDGFVIIPGIVRGKESGKLCLALLELDLSSSGEHWGTHFLCEHGVVKQGDIGNNPAEKAIISSIGSYDYCYTATIPGDIHVSKSRLPEEIKAVLEDFRNHIVNLIVEDESLQSEGSDHIDFTYALDDNRLLIRDNGNISIVDNIENIISNIKRNHEGQTIDEVYYCDPTGNWTKLLKDNGKFEVPAAIENPSVSDRIFASSLSGIEVHISAQEFQSKMKELLPGASEKAIKQLISYAEELDGEKTYPQGAFFSESYVNYNLAVCQHGADIIGSVLKVCEEFCLNPWEIRDAASLMANGASQGDIVQKSVEGELDYQPEHRIALEAGLVELQNGTLNVHAVAENPSVLDRIREAEKVPKKPRKGKSTKNKKETEH